MSNEIGSRVRYGEAFWRAHHEAWQQSALRQREYCEARGIPLKAFGNWRARFTTTTSASRVFGTHRWPSNGGRFNQGETRRPLTPHLRLCARVCSPRAPPQSGILAPTLPCMILGPANRKLPKQQ